MPIFVTEGLVGPESISMGIVAYAEDCMKGKKAESAQYWSELKNATLNPYGIFSPCFTWAHLLTSGGTDRLKSPLESTTLDVNGLSWQAAPFNAVVNLLVVIIEVFERNNMELVGGPWW